MITNLATVNLSANADKASKTSSNTAVVNANDRKQQQSDNSDDYLDDEGQGCLTPLVNLRPLVTPLQLEKYAAHIGHPYPQPPKPNNLSANASANANAHNAGTGAGMTTEAKSKRKGRANKGGAVGGGTNDGSCGEFDDGSGRSFGNGRSLHELLSTTNANSNSRNGNNNSDAGDSSSGGGFVNMSSSQTRVKSLVSEASRSQVLQLSLLPTHSALPQVAPPLLALLGAGYGYAVAPAPLSTPLDGPPKQAKQQQSQSQGQSSQSQSLQSQLPPPLPPRTWSGVPPVNTAAPAMSTGHNNNNSHGGGRNGNNVTGTRNANNSGRSTASAGAYAPVPVFVLTTADLVTYTEALSSAAAVTSLSAVAAMATATTAPAPKPPSARAHAVDADGTDATAAAAAGASTAPSNAAAAVVVRGARVISPLGSSSSNNNNTTSSSAANGVRSVGNNDSNGGGGDGGGALLRFPLPASSFAPASCLYSRLPTAAAPLPLATELLFTLLLHGLNAADPALWKLSRAARRQAAEAEAAAAAARQRHCELQWGKYWRRVSKWESGLSTSSGTLSVTSDDKGVNQSLSTRCGSGSGSVNVPVCVAKALTVASAFSGNKNTDSSSNSSSTDVVAAATEVASALTSLACSHKPILPAAAASAAVPLVVTVPAALLQPPSTSGRTSPALFLPPFFRSCLRAVETAEAAERARVTVGLRLRERAWLWRLAHDLATAAATPLDIGLSTPAAALTQQQQPQSQQQLQLQYKPVSVLPTALALSGKRPLLSTLLLQQQQQQHSSSSSSGGGGGGHSRFSGGIMSVADAAAVLQKRNAIAASGNVSTPLAAHLLPPLHPTLPIDSFRATLAATLASRPVAVVAAETGSGKTTRVPLFVLEAMLADRLSLSKTGLSATGVSTTGVSAPPRRGGAKYPWSWGKVICAQPRRITATSTATHVASQVLDWAAANSNNSNSNNIVAGSSSDDAKGGGSTIYPGLSTPTLQQWPRPSSLVGYSVRFDHKAHPRSPLLYCTNGILLRRLRADPLLSDVSVVILDEVHERSVEIDFLLVLLRRTLVTRARLAAAAALDNNNNNNSHANSNASSSAVCGPLRLIVMSATLSSAQMSEYFHDASLAALSCFATVNNTAFGNISNNSKSKNKASVGNGIFDSNRAQAVVPVASDSSTASAAAAVAINSAIVAVSGAAAKAQAEAEAAAAAAAAAAELDAWDASDKEDDGNDNGSNNNNKDTAVAAAANSEAANAADVAAVEVAAVAAEAATEAETESPDLDAWDASDNEDAAAAASNNSNSTANAVTSVDVVPENKNTSQAADSSSSSVPSTAPAAADNGDDIDIDSDDNDSAAVVVTVDSKNPLVPCLSVPGRTYPVEIKYLDQALAHCGYLPALLAATSDSGGLGPLDADRGHSERGHLDSEYLPGEVTVGGYLSSCFGPQWREAKAAWLRRWTKVTGETYVWGALEQPLLPSLETLFPDTTTNGAGAGAGANAADKLLADEDDDDADADAKAKANVAVVAIDDDDEDEDAKQRAQEQRERQLAIAKHHALSLSTIANNNNSNGSGSGSNAAGLVKPHVGWSAVPAPLRGLTLNDSFLNLDVVEALLTALVMRRIAAMAEGTVPLPPHAAAFTRAARGCRYTSWLLSGNNNNNNNSSSGGGGGSGTGVDRLCAVAAAALPPPAAAQAQGLLRYCDAFGGVPTSAGVCLRASDVLAARDSAPPLVEGAVLIFLPGLAHIKALAKRIEANRLLAPSPAHYYNRESGSSANGSSSSARPGDNNAGFVGNGASVGSRGAVGGLTSVSVLHSAVPWAAQQQAFRRPPPHELRIILSTNIAETGVTLPFVSCVIDCGKEHQSSHSSLSAASGKSGGGGGNGSGSGVAGSGTQVLSCKPISRASAQQRAGRAGRTGPGVCYRLFSEPTFSRRMEHFTVPELLRVPVLPLVMHILAAGSANTRSPTGTPMSTPMQAVSSGVFELLSQCLDPPPLSAVVAAVASLGRHGIVRLTLAANNNSINNNTTNPTTIRNVNALTHNAPSALVSRDSSNDEKNSQQLQQQQQQVRCFVSATNSIRVLTPSETKTLLAASSKYLSGSVSVSSSSLSQSKGYLDAAADSAAAATIYRTTKPLPRPQLTLTLTSLGRVAAALPLSPPASLLCVLGVVFRCVDAAAVLAASLEVGDSPFKGPPAPAAAGAGAGGRQQQRGGGARQALEAAQDREGAAKARAKFGTYAPVAIERSVSTPSSSAVAVSTSAAVDVSGSTSSVNGSWLDGVRVRVGMAPAPVPFAVTVGRVAVPLSTTAASAAAAAATTQSHSLSLSNPGVTEYVPATSKAHYSDQVSIWLAYKGWRAASAIATQAHTYTSHSQAHSQSRPHTGGAGADWGAVCTNRSRAFCAQYGLDEKAMADLHKAKLQVLEVLTEVGLIPARPQVGAAASASRDNRNSYKKSNNNNNAVKDSANAKSVNANAANADSTNTNDNDAVADTGDNADNAEDDDEPSLLGNNDDDDEDDDDDDADTDNDHNDIVDADTQLEPEPEPATGSASATADMSSPWSQPLPPWANSPASFNALTDCVPLLVSLVTTALAHNTMHVAPPSLTAAAANNSNSNSSYYNSNSNSSGRSVAKTAPVCVPLPGSLRFTAPLDSLLRASSLPLALATPYCPIPLHYNPFTATNPNSKSSQQRSGASTGTGGFVRNGGCGGFLGLYGSKHRAGGGAATVRETSLAHLPALALLPPCPFADGGARDGSVLAPDWAIYPASRAAVTGAGVAVRVAARTAVVCKYVQILVQSAVADAVEEATLSNHSNSHGAGRGGVRNAGDSSHSTGAGATGWRPRLSPALRNELLWTVLEALNTPLVEA